MLDDFDILNPIPIRKKEERNEAERARHLPMCEHPGCLEAGAYKAPKSRYKEGIYYHFCLDHVRAFNQSYDYFRGMSDEDVMRFQEASITGLRPTWSMGLHNAQGQRRPSGMPPLSDPFDMLRDTGAAAVGGARPTSLKITPEERKAFTTMDLPLTAKAQEIRARYKELVKRHHPDANGGSREDEDKLRAILDAYQTLKANGHLKE